MTFLSVKEALLTPEFYLDNWCINGEGRIGKPTAIDSLGAGFFGEGLCGQGWCAHNQIMRINGLDRSALESLDDTWWESFDGVFKYCTCPPRPIKIGVFEWRRLDICEWCRKPRKEEIVK